MSQLFGRGKLSKPDETIQRAKEKIIDLSGLTFTGAAKARFTFTEPTSSDFYDDIAIDDVKFYE